jgi:septal ring factor EnvC (AmiA/AmiB activator)
MKFLAEHKHLVIVIISAIALYAMVAKIQSHFDGVAHDQRIIQEQQVKADLEKARADAEQTHRDRDDLTRQLSTLAQSNADLKTSLIALRSQLQAQQAKDATLPPDALAERWGALIGSPGQLKLEANGILASLAAAHTTVAQLEELPVLREETNQKDRNGQQKDVVITRLQSVTEDLTRELGTCKVTIADKDELCRKQLDEVKARARKRERNWFVAGLVAATGLIFGLKH